MAKTPSKLVLAFGSKIEQTSDVKLKFGSGTTAPVQEWIPETEMDPTKAIKLRTAAETQQDGVTKLKQFNPSFFLVGEQNAIPCRVPGCNKTTPRLKPSGGSQHIKQDLFLCEIHRTKLANLVSKRCEEENISVNVASFKHEDFDGYTYLIGELEKAFMHLVKKPATLNMPQNSLYPNNDLVLAEVFLNARNFLTITHALLNPNGDNIGVALPAIFAMFGRIMSLLTQADELLKRAVTALREIMEIILNFFGIIYVWVNLGTQIVGAAGLLGAIALPFPLILSLVVEIVICVVRLFSGARESRQQRYETERQNQRVHEYREFIRQHFGQAVPRAPWYHVPANAMGDLELDVRYMYL